MKFIVDAHVPRGLCRLLARHGHDVIHTHELAEGNATKDGAINQVSVDEQRVVISKDSDFFYSHLLQGRPWKLLLVKTGNISTQDLCAVFERNMAAVENALEQHTLVEIDWAAVRPVV